MPFSVKVGKVEFLTWQSGQVAAIIAFVIVFEDCGGFLCSSSSRTVVTILHYRFMLVSPMANVKVQKVVVIFFRTLFQEHGDIGKLKNARRRDDIEKCEFTFHYMSRRELL